MQGDQLSWPCRTVWDIDASHSALTLAEIAKREETGIRAIYRSLETLQTAKGPLYTQGVARASRWAVVETFKSKLPSFFQHPPIEIFFFEERYIDASYFRQYRSIPSPGP
jgi:hypothetical protein